jgi:hypothetical protein
MYRSFNKNLISFERILRNLELEKTGAETEEESETETEAQT